MEVPEVSLEETHAPKGNCGPTQVSMGKVCAGDDRSAWEAFLDQVHLSIRELTRSGATQGEMWFRGHSLRSQTLLPALLRGYGDVSSERTRRHVRGMEHDLYREYTVRMREFHGVTAEDWDNLFAMHECGAPTRLLEWTSSVATALCFALNQYDRAPPSRAPEEAEARACIWILNPYALNGLAPPGSRITLSVPSNAFEEGSSALRGSGYCDLLRTGFISKLRAIAVHPPHRTTRMQLQRSWYTLHGDGAGALDLMPGREKCLRCVTIPPEAHGVAREYLLDSGVDLMALFRDPAHIGIHLQKRNAESRNRFLKLRLS